MTAVTVLPFVALFGAVMGSFLNVVIYRLPRGLSLHRPRRSICPACRSQIRFVDNIPILSWFLLEGKCRRCRSPIPLTYPLIECLCVLVFLGVWDALFLAPAAEPTGFPVFLPIAVVVLSLFAGLLSLAAMDIEEYTINIEVCIGVMVISTILLGIAECLPRPIGSAPVASFTPLPALLDVVGGAMGLVWALTAIAIRWLRRSPPDETLPDAAPKPGDTSGEDPSSKQVPAGGRFQPVPIVLLVLLTAALFAWMRFATDHGLPLELNPALQRGVLLTALCFFVLVLSSLVPRAADRQIVEEIEAERHAARGVVLRELAVLTPALLVGAALFLLLRGGAAAEEYARTWLPGFLGAGKAASFAAGTLSAVSACVWISAMGWAIRILGTLAFRKEAFGTGDIYIMAAIAAGGGIWLAFFGFFFAVGFALVGVIATSLRRRSRTIPFGPWLGLGAFFALFAAGDVLRFFAPAARFLWATAANLPVDYASP